MAKLLFALMMSAACTTAFAADNCEEIKNKIDDRIKSMGVVVYKLQVADKDAVVNGKIVGSCDGGKKKDRVLETVIVRLFYR